jgi:hypothetical protein
VLLKKALEYNWWTDVTKTDRLNSSFKRWLSNNYPDELGIFDERYEITRTLHIDNGFLSHRTHKFDQEVKNMR